MNIKKLACDHCGLEFDEDVMIEDAGKYFCCKGCQGVYHLLQSDGLDSFYSKKGSTTLSPVDKKVQDLAKFDLEGFQKRYVKTLDDGNCAVSLIIEHIHCAACVWLNEKILYQSEGIIEVNINYTDHKAKIIWDPNKIKLSQIIEKIQAIGYDAYAYDPKVAEERVLKQRKDYYIKLSVAIFTAMNIMWLAIAKYFGFFSGMEKDLKFVISFAEFVLATPALFFSGWIFFRGAYYGLKNKIVNMDLLVATGASLVYFYSIYVLFSGIGETYFDSVVMIITFILVGKYFEVLSKKSAGDSLDSLRAQIPDDVTVLVDGDEKTLSAQEVQKGDIVVLKPGDLAVVDGIVQSGEGSLDESSLTGEAKPLFKKAGDKIISATTNLDSTLTYKVTQNFEHSTLNNLTTLLEQAQSKKPKIQEATTRLSQYFSATILTIAFITFWGWYLYGAGFEQSFIVAVAVIIIACPCALALATPVATLVGLSTAYKKGVLFKEARHIETIAKTKILLLDKTGTITYGKPKVVDHSEFEAFDKDILYTMLDGSKHPVSKGVKEFIGGAQKITLESYQALEAKGLCATYRGKEYVGGNQNYLKSLGYSLPKEYEKSHFLFGCEGKVLAAYELEDEIKKGVKQSLQRLRKLGLNPVMVTGDNKKAALEIAQKVGITQCFYEQSPMQKAQVVQSFGGKVLMVGDGVNDSLAFSYADIACAMGSGADTSINVSDVVLLHDSMQNLEDAVAVGKTTYGFVKQNLALSLVYNALTIPLAIAGFIIPLVAAASMSLSSLIVVGNSMRIKFKHRG
ncbi:MAG: heavy metal translocating P-type ATPase [Campylobacterota bacterium]